MTHEFYLTVEGAKQGRFKGESLRNSHKHDIPALRFNYQATAETSKSKHSPVMLTKELGAATPQFFEALITKEILKTVVIRFVGQSVDGVENVFHCVRLTNARVVQIRQYTGSAAKGDPVDGREIEDIALVFQRIEMENREGRTTASADQPRKS